MRLKGFPLSIAPKIIRKTGARLLEESSAPFVPTDIGGCLLYLPSDLGITHDGDPTYRVSKRADQTDNGNDVSQTTDSKKPVWEANVLNGHPGILFDAVDDGMLTSSSIVHLPEGKQSLTVFSVRKTGPSSENVFGVLGWNYNNTVGSLCLLNVWGTPRVYMFHTDWLEEVLIFNELSFAVNTYYHILLVRNGTASISLTLNDSTQTLIPADKDIGDLNRLGIGCHSYGGTDFVYPWGSYIFDDAIYDSALSAGNQALLRTYSNTRYGL